MLHVHVSVCVCVSCTRLFFVVRVLTAAIWDIRAVRCPLASSWQTRQEHMPIAGLNWWPHTPPHPVYLRRGRSCVTDLEYLASLNKLRFTRWPMEKQRQRFVLHLQSYLSTPGLFGPSSGPSRLFSFFKLSSLFLQFLRALRICFPVLASHPVKRTGERRCLCGTITARQAGTYRLTK